MVIHGAVPCAIVVLGICELNEVGCLKYRLDGILPDCRSKIIHTLPKPLQTPLQRRRWGLCGRGLSKNLPNRCPVLGANGNLRGEQDYVAKAGEAKTIIVSILLDNPLIKEGIFLQHHLTKGAVSHEHLEYSL